MSRVGGRGGKGRDGRASLIPLLAVRKHSLAPFLHIVPGLTRSAEIEGSGRAEIRMISRSVSFLSDLRGA